MTGGAGGVAGAVGGVAGAVGVASAASKGVPGTCSSEKGCTQNETMQNIINKTDTGEIWRYSNFI